MLYKKKTYFPLVYIQLLVFCYFVLSFDNSYVFCIFVVIFMMVVVVVVSFGGGDDNDDGGSKQPFVMIDFIPEMFYFIYFNINATARTLNLIYFQNICNNC